MTGHLRWVPPRIDMEMPHPARMHDYWLGGGHNFAADRALAEEIIQLMPGVEDIARVNQAFLRRSALFLVSQGIRQFLDIGSGIPTVGNLHDIVQRAHPDCRVVYVDNDPVAAAHSELILDGVPGTAVLQVDVREADRVLDDEVTRSLLDIDEPIGLLAPMLHFIPDSSDPVRMVADYRDRLVAGSWLVILHGTADVTMPGIDELIKAYQRTRHRLYPRTHAEVLAMCEGFDLVEPGLVGYGHWQPEGPGDFSVRAEVNSLLYGGVGVKS